MALKSREAIKLKIETFVSRLKDGRPGALPAVITLIMLALIILFFNIADDSDSPTTKKRSSRTSVSKLSQDRNTLGLIDKESFQDQLNKLIESTKKKPFKAKVTTELGLKGYWTQDGLNYRFEDPSKSHIIILNSSQEKFWVINLPGRVAHEMPFDASNLSGYNGLVPTLLIEGLSTSTVTGTKNLDEILPGGENAKLTFTPDGLPDRWDGSRMDGTACFIDWDYIQSTNILPAEFELPRGLKVSVQAPSTTTATSSTTTSTSR